MAHSFSVFVNSCVKVPVDPVNKMPKAAYERKKDTLAEQASVDSNSTIGSGIIDISAERIKDFYRTIPDYNEIHHLPPEEFYSTLNRLREKKNMMLGISLDFKYNCYDPLIMNSHKPSVSISDKKIKSTFNDSLTRKSLKDDYFFEDTKKPETLKPKPKTDVGHEVNLPKSSPSKGVLTNAETNKTSRAKRIGSACSISWNDLKNKEKDDIDDKFDKYFEGKNYKSKDYDHEFKTQSMPSSPVKTKHLGSPLRRRKSITIPKPFKMSERDDDLRMINDLRNLRKCFSDEMLNQKKERKLFRARPVPIESRIPLYDKILEDQAMRRAMTKINSEAELRAQMKPFSFTKREEKSLYPGTCKRAINAIPSTKKKKRFKARPVPKDLFSNYVYNKNKADDFFRSVNRRIRAEEMLKTSSLPSNMAARERSRLSTPAAHSDLPIDPSPIVPSTSSSGRRTKSPTKERKKNGGCKKEFITTSPQPFRFNTATRAAKKMEDLTKKIYTESLTTTSMSNSVPNVGARALSALELRNHASGRSNLAALLRAEAVRQKFDTEAASRFADLRRKMEMRARDRLLRTNPAWSLVRNNHEEEIALRLRTRRDEERMRHEEFMHEMELMYGRVNQQPMLFERYYAPKYYQLPLDSIQLSPRKGLKKKSKKYTDISRYESPCLSQKQDNDTYRKGAADYLNRIDNDDKLFSDSEQAVESIDGCNKKS